MIYLVGINHSFQVRAVLPFGERGLENAGSANVAVALEAYVGELVDRYRIRTVAEECSAECLIDKLQVDQKAYLVAKRVCEQRGHVQHIFCDPNRTERKALYAAAGVSEADDARLGFPIRESEWLRRLRPHIPLGELLFLCGTNHVPSFLQRLTEAHIATIVACEDFGAHFLANSS